MGAIGRISGPLLKSNLLRNGVDLAFETDLLYLDVNNQRIGVKTATPSHDLHVAGTTRTTQLIVDDLASIGGIDISGNTIESATEITLTTSPGDAVIIEGRLEINDIIFENNEISTLGTDTDLNISIAGNGIVNFFAETVIEENLTVQGDLFVTGDVTITGNIQIGDETTDTIEFVARVGSDLIPESNELYNLGSTNLRWNTIWVGEVRSDSVRIDNNIIETVEADTNLILKADGTGSVHLEDVSFTDNVISTVTSGDLIFETDPGHVIKFETVESITIPVGTTAQRPVTPQAGMLRFNTTTEEYEGYNGTNWIRLRGVYDEDEDTFITAELTPGANDNTIRFFANSNLIADIDETRFNTSVIDVGDIKIFGNTIETINENDDLLIRAEGENASVIIENFAFNQNAITNVVPGSVTEFFQTGDGYFKIDSTRGFVVPLGTSSQRPAVPVIGLTRYNTDLELVEIYDGTSWVSVAGAEGGLTTSAAENIAIETVLILG